MDKKVIKKCEEFLKKYKNNHKSIATFCKVSSELEKVEFLGRGCHAAMNGKSGLNGSCVAVASVFYNSSKLHEETVKKYLNWLVNESPWEEIFWTKDVDYIYEYGFITRTDVPSNLLQGGLCASRYPWENWNWLEEYLFKVPGFWNYSDLINKNFAFYFSHFLSRSGQGYDIKYATIGGHSCIAYSPRQCKFETLKNFTQNNRVHLEDLYINTNKYSNVNKTWDKNIGKILSAGEDYSSYIHNEYKDLIFTEELKTGWAEIATLNSFITSENLLKIAELETKKIMELK